MKINFKIDKTIDNIKNSVLQNQIDAWNDIVYNGRGFFNVALRQSFVSLWVYFEVDFDKKKK